MCVLQPRPGDLPCRTGARPAAGRFEGAVLVVGSPPGAGDDRRGYALCFVAFGLLGAAFLFALLLPQQHLPGGPDDRFLSTPMTPDLAANTAVSFATTTTWQAYGGGPPSAT